MRRIGDKAVRRWTSLTAGVAGQPALELLEPQTKEAGLRRVVDRAAFEHRPQKNTGCLELVHVLEDEHFHLPCPKRHRGPARIALDRRPITAGPRKVPRPTRWLTPLVGDPPPA